MMRSFARSRLCRVLLAAALLGSIAACGGNVVVDGPPGSGGAGASTTGTTTGTTMGTTTGTGTTTVTGPQVPDGGSAECQQQYTSVIGELDNALGCTPSANIPQCTGKALLHDPCGCLFVANDAHPYNINTANSAWGSCVMDGCCGPQASIGCAPCPPPPTSGHCDSFTSQCVAGTGG
jgi:hypothetical protein